jgi:hypothetical protein
MSPHSCTQRIFALHVEKINGERPAPQLISDLSVLSLSRLKLLYSFTERPRADFVLAFLKLLL